MKCFKYNTPTIDTHNESFHYPLSATKVTYTDDFKIYMIVKFSNVSLHQQSIRWNRRSPQQLKNEYWRPPAVHNGILGIQYLFIQQKSPIVNLFETPTSTTHQHLRPHSLPKTVQYYQPRNSLLPSPVVIIDSLSRPQRCQFSRGVLIVQSGINTYSTYIYTKPYTHTEREGSESIEVHTMIYLFSKSAIQNQCSLW